MPRVQFDVQVRLKVRACPTNGASIVGGTLCGGWVGAAGGSRRLLSVLPADITPHHDNWNIDVVPPPTILSLHHIDAPRDRAVSRQP